MFLGVYLVPCPRGACYVGQMGRTVLACCREHEWYFGSSNQINQRWQNTRSANHQTLFDSVQFLVQVDNYWERVITEAVAIAVDDRVVNSDLGLMLCPAWSRYAADKVGAY